MELSDADWTDARWKSVLDAYYAAHPSEHPWTIPEIRERTAYMCPSTRTHNVMHFILPSEPAPSTKQTVLTFNVPLSPQSATVLPRDPVMVRIMSGIEMFKQGDHLVLKTKGIYHHGIVTFCDRANIDVVHFDEEGVHRTLLGQFWPKRSDGYRINYAHYDLTKRKRAVAHAEVFANSDFKSHPLATGPEDYLAYCLAGTWNVPTKQVPIPPPDLPSIPLGQSKDIGSCCIT